MGDNQFYGWYDTPDQAPDQPSYNPPFDGPCLFCGKALTETDVRTHSIMMVSHDYAKRAYFYRTHRTCDEKSPAAMDGFIWDMIARNGD